MSHHEHFSNGRECADCHALFSCADIVYNERDTELCPNCPSWKLDHVVVCEECTVARPAPGWDLCRGCIQLGVEGDEKIRRLNDVDWAYLERVAGRNKQLESA